MATLTTNTFKIDLQEVAKAKTSLLNERRKALGLPVIQAHQFKSVGGQPYLSKPGIAIMTGLKAERGFVYLNLNGGDSWGYYHPEDNPEYIYNFKGEPVYKTEELLPEYWASLRHIDPQSSKGKVRYFVCRDFRTDRLYNGLFYSEENRLEMARAQNETRLRSFLKQHGQPVQDFIPDFEVEYDPHAPYKFAFEERKINTYIPSSFEAIPPLEVKTITPTVARIIASAVGTGETFDHFINWLAHLVQFKEKIGTAWCLHGNEGTGKGLLFHQIITPILGESNVASITMRTLDSPYNGFMERALVVFVDEVQIPVLKGSLGISADLRNFITEHTISIRHMYTEPYNTKNYANFIFASNMPDPIVVPSTDRRFHIGTFQDKALKFTPENFKSLTQEIESFYQYLRAYPVDRVRSTTILLSLDRDRLQKLSMTAADTMATSILQGDLEDLVDNLPHRAVFPTEVEYVRVIKEILGEHSTQTGSEIKDHKITRDDLLTIFRYRVGEVPDSPNKFTSFLKHHRIHTEKLRKSERLYYGIRVTWKQSPGWARTQLISMNQPTASAAVTLRPRVSITR